MPYRCFKHIDVSVHFIMNIVRAGKITALYVPTNENVSSVMTEPLRKLSFVRMIEKLRMVEVDKSSEDE